jgi:hypothetical protein
MVTQLDFQENMIWELSIKIKLSFEAQLVGRHTDSHANRTKRHRLQPIALLSGRYTISVQGHLHKFVGMAIFKVMKSVMVGILEGILVRHSVEKRH